MQYLDFASGSSEVAVEFFCLFVSFVQNLPYLCMYTVIFNPIQFLCILLSRRGVSRCKQALGQKVPGPSLSYMKWLELRFFFN